MERMTVNQLRDQYAEVFQEPTRSRHKQYLIKRIAWRMQANAEGGLSERALQRALELANRADLRLTAPRPSKAMTAQSQPIVSSGTQSLAARTLLPGMVLERDYKGRRIRVLVLTHGLEYEGERYKSLTAVTKAITGKHWNGYHFFGLHGKGNAR